MKRRLLSVLVLLGGAVGVAQADFLIIVANLGRPGGPVMGPGGRPLPGGPPAAPGRPAAPNTFDLDSLPSMVIEVLEVEHAQPRQLNELSLQQGKAVKVKHPFGGTTLVVPSGAV